MRLINTDAGQVYAFGCGKDGSHSHDIESAYSHFVGRLGHGTGADVAHPCPITTFESMRIAAMDAGGAHSMFITGNTRNLCLIHYHTPRPRSNLNNISIIFLDLFIYIHA
jgi:hypothetical protein